MRLAFSYVLAALALQSQPDLLSRGPAIITKCAPQYTRQAKAAKIEGQVILYVQVYSDGLAHNIRIQRGLDSGLDENAVAAVKHWRFRPGMKEGKAVVTPATIEVNFRLNDRSEPCRAAPQTQNRQRNGRT
jgi:TonB family protein